MKDLYGVFDETLKYNLIYDGHGTGLAPLTVNQYERLIGSLFIVDHIVSPAPLNNAYDLSADPCFPLVGDQGTQGSCSAWAATYYANGYLQAKSHSWNQAHLGNPDHLLSPAWTYNKCNGGADYGSFPYDNAFIMRDVGVCRLSQMPYDELDCIDWGSEPAWRDAPSFRINHVYEFLHPYNFTHVDAIRDLINNGIPVTFCLDASSYTYFGSDDVVGSDAMRHVKNHANTIVGYNNSKQDHETGEIGAFKVVNSWGESWGPNNDGFYWITYQAFLGSWNTGPVNFFQDRYRDTSPSLLAVWRLHPAPNRDADTSLCIMKDDIIYDTKLPWWDGYSQVMHPYPSFLCLDITEFSDDWVSNASIFCLDIEDSAGEDGTITSFTIEYYFGDYSSGNPSRPSAESPDTPQNTPGFVLVSFPWNETIIYVDDDNIVGPWDGSLQHPYQAIQDALAAAIEGDIICIFSGLYSENLVIDKNNLTIIGENKNTTIIFDDSTYSYIPAIEITADAVTFAHTMIASDNGSTKQIGIDIYGNQCHIHNTILALDCDVGINLAEYTHHNTISSNSIAGYISSSIGVLIGTASTNHIITKNTIHGFGLAGIQLEHTNNNTISQNTLYNNSIAGVHSTDCSDIKLSNNTFSSNRDYGIYLDNTHKNHIFDNIFFNDGLFSFNSYENTVDNNTINGKPLVYFENASDRTIQNAGQIILVNCRNISVADLNISRVPVGVYLWASDDCHVRNTSLFCKNSGIESYYSRDCNFSQNRMTNAGVRVSRSRAFTVAENTFFNCGLGIEWSYHNTVVGNTVNGKPLVYLENTSNLTIALTGAGQIICVNVSNITLTNQEISNTSAGIQLWNVQDCHIISNIIENASSGIELLGGSQNNTISQNILLDNYRAVKIYHGDDNTMHRNTISRNTIGMHFLSGARNIVYENTISYNQRGVLSGKNQLDNLFYHNNFLFNEKNAQDGGTNYWDHPFLEEGNYWDDYTGIDANGDGIGDTPYDVPHGDNQDQYPLMQPWVFHNHPPLLSNVSPMNGTIGVARPPAELNVTVQDGDGNIMNVYIRWKTHTAAWVTLQESFGCYNGTYRCFPSGNDWIWGNTTYTWSVNVTDGTSWTNKTYWYTTGGSRYDVNNNNIVNFQDAGLVWIHRTSLVLYDGLYDVNQDGQVNFQDAGLTWINRN